MVVGRGEVNSFDFFSFSFSYTQDFGYMKSTKDINISKIDKKMQKTGIQISTNKVKSAILIKCILLLADCIFDIHFQLT